MFKTITSLLVATASCLTSAYASTNVADDIGNVKLLKNVSTYEQIHILPDTDLIVTEDANIKGLYVVKSFTLLDNVRLDVEGDFTIIAEKEIYFGGPVISKKSLAKGYDISLKAYRNIHITSEVVAGEAGPGKLKLGSKAPRGGQFFAYTPNFLMDSFIYAGKGADALDGMSGGSGGSAIVLGDPAGHTNTTREFSAIFGGNAGTAGEYKEGYLGHGADGGHALFIPNEAWLFMRGIDRPYFLDSVNFSADCAKAAIKKNDLFNNQFSSNVIGFSGNLFLDCSAAPPTPAEGVSGSTTNSTPHSQAPQQTSNACTSGAPGNKGGNAVGGVATAGKAGQHGGQGQDGGDGSDGGTGGGARSGYGEHGSHAGDCSCLYGYEGKTGGDGGDSGDAEGGKGKNGGWLGVADEWCTNGEFGSGGDSGWAVTRNGGWAGNGGKGTPGGEKGKKGKPGTPTTKTPGKDGYVGAPGSGPNFPGNIDVSTPGTTGETGGLITGDPGFAGSDGEDC